MDGSSSTSSTWSPLRHARYRAFWLAGLAAYIGVWMQNVGAAWLMATLTSSPILIASVQFANSLPAFLLCLPAGLLADQGDRRRLILATQIWSLIVALVVAALAFGGWIGPWSLIVCTVLLGAGAALAGPATQSVIVDLVPRQDLPQAVMLGSMSFNAARAIGPALAGLIIGALNSATVFVVSALGCVAMIAVMRPMRLAPRETALPAERLFSGMRAGLRYAFYSPPVMAAMVRSAVFGLFAAAIWALMPLLVVQSAAEGGGGGFGAMVACMGAGAVLSVFAAPALRDRVGADASAVAASMLYALAMLAAALLQHQWLLYGVMVLAGIGWMLMLNTTFAALQTVLPPWVRARGIAVYMLVFQGAMAFGSLLWGGVAEGVGAHAALAIAAAGLAVCTPLAYRLYRLTFGEESQVTPVPPWIEPVMGEEIAHDAGPVAVEIEYRVEATQRRAFREAIEALGPIRRRDGAMFWRLYRDIAEPDRYRERFIVDSWLEYLRSRGRGTRADRELEDRVRAFHAGPEPIRVTHSISESTGS